MNKECVIDDLSDDPYVNWDRETHIRYAEGLLNRGDNPPTVEGGMEALAHLLIAREIKS